MDVVDAFNSANVALPSITDFRLLPSFADKIALGKICFRPSFEKSGMFFLFSLTFVSS